MKCFTRETLEVDKANDKVQLTTFNASLAKNPPKTMVEMLLKVQKYMNAEDAVAAIRMTRSQETKEGKMTNVKGKRGSVQIEELLTRIDGGTTKAPGW